MKVAVSISDLFRHYGFVPFDTPELAEGWLTKEHFTFYEGCPQMWVRNGVREITISGTTYVINGALVARVRAEIEAEKFSILS